MRKNLSLVILTAFASTAMAQQTIHVTVENPTNAPRTDQPVVIDLAQYGQVQSALVKTDNLEIPCQLDDLDQNECFDELCFLADLKAKEKKQYTVTLYAEGEPRQYPARVFTEMLVRNDKVKEKNKHNNFLESITARGDCANSYNIQHHHGVDFESELNGIRNISTSARPSISMVSSRNAWNYRRPSFIPPRNRRPRVMATMYYG